MGNFAQDNEKEPKAWSIMVYLAGGKDVSDEARESLLRMKQVGSTKNIHVIAQFDSGSEGTSTKRYYLSPCSNAMQIESILTKACSEMSTTVDPLDAAVGAYYCQLLKNALSVNLAENERNRLQATMQTEGMIKLLKYSPSRFKNLVLNLVLDKDIYPIKGDLGQTNAGNPKVLLDFVKWAKKTYPAERHMVIVWGHGNGLSVAWDYPASPARGRKDSITASEFLRFSSMLEPERGKYKVNIVGFNSCSLGTIEIYRQLKGFVEFGIASEGFTPKTSWPYDKILNGLNLKSEMTPKEFATEIVEQYKKHYKGSVLSAQKLQREQRKMRAKGLGMTLDMNRVQDMYEPVDLGGKGVGLAGKGVGLAEKGVGLAEKGVGLAGKGVGLGSQEEASAIGIDLSLCELKESDPVSAEMKKLVGLILRTFWNGKDQAAYNLFGAIVGAHALSQSYFNKDFTDLSDFCRALSTFCPMRSIQNACQAVIDAIQGMCIKKEHVGEDVGNSNGVSIFFPWGEWGERDVIAGYGKLQFLKDTQWGVFLQKYRKLADCFERNPKDFNRKMRKIRTEH